MLSYKVKKYQFPWFSVQQIAKCDLDHQSRVDGGERQQTELEEAGCERRDDAWPPARFSDNTRTTSHKHKSTKPFSTNMKRVWRNPISPQTEITRASWQIRRAVELRPHWVTAEAAASTPNIQLTVCFFPFWSHHSFTSTSFCENIFHRGNYWIGWLGLQSSPASPLPSFRLNPGICRVPTSPSSPEHGPPGGGLNHYWTQGLMFMLVPFNNVLIILM